MRTIVGGAFSGAHLAGAWWLLCSAIFIVDRAAAQSSSAVHAELTAVFRARSLIDPSKPSSTPGMTPIVEVWIDTTGFGTDSVPLLRASNLGHLHSMPILFAVVEGEALLLGGSEAPELVPTARAMGVRLGVSLEEDRRVALLLARLLDPLGAKRVIAEADVESYPPKSIPRLREAGVSVGAAVCIQVSSYDVGFAGGPRRFRYCFQAGADGRVIAWAGAEAEKAP